MTHWDRVAAWYDGLVGQRGSDYHRDVVIPGAMRLLACRPGEKVLDVGCGQGVLCRSLAEAGAHAVGVDASVELIDRARARGKGPRTARSSAPGGAAARGGSTRFEVLDAREVEQLAGGPFDAVACLLAIQNIEPFEAVLGACGRILKPGGRLVLVMTHPAFRIPRQSGWGWDHPRELQYRRVDQYMSRLQVPIQAHPGADPEIYTLSFHRPLQDYFAAIAAGGLLVSSLEEWCSPRSSRPGSRSRAENRARAEFPLFLAIRAEKREEKRPGVRGPAGVRG